LWLCDGGDGERADLRYANLSGADLRCANLVGADLTGANLSCANLAGAYLIDANLTDADLSCADLSGADLSDANLSCANLVGADLSDANLSGANLSEANLSGANLSEANLSDIQANENTAFFVLQCPEEGAFVAWKKCENNVIVKLLIPEDAKRSSATTRKCRASKAIVLEVIGAEKGISQKDKNFIYEVGKEMIPDSFDDDRWNECSNGIHFFITRKEAENY
jgi:uncharacterized protein YjbI with pentapeptide repeats